MMIVQRVTHFVDALEVPGHEEEVGGRFLRVPCSLHEKPFDDLVVKKIQQVRKVLG